MPTTQEEYVIVPKSILTNIADTVRDISGNADSIPVVDLASQLVEALEAYKPIIFNDTSFVSGTFTPKGNAANYTVEHNLGRIPQHALIFLGAQEVYSRTKPHLLFASIYSSPAGDRIACLYGTTTSSNSAYYVVNGNPNITMPSEDVNALSYYANVIYGATENTISFGDPTGENTLYLISSRPYYWIVW